ncbi:MAG: RNA-binding transcriptional accessory protein, partial [Candidatus Aegiribacteria sp.]|nr:RNA-binding transcriptional accessory protein [Candidatus Aegiribacteria sp.]
ELLTDELKKELDDAETLTTLEDIYLPFRPKRRTRATRAREKGLEPLAERILLQRGENLSEYAKEFIDPEKGVETVDDALAGAQDIIAEKLTEIPRTRESMRRYYWEKGVFRSRVRSGQEEEGSKFRDYYEWDEPVGRCPSHRVLAMLRGEKQNVLSLKITVPEERAVEIVSSNWIENPESEEGLLIQEAVRDGYRRLLAKAIETETRLRSKESADDEAIAVFSENLRKLLLAAPLGSETVMAIDPGFRTGCKVVCLDSQGVLQSNAVIFPFMSEEKKKQAGITVLQLIKQYGASFIAVGNGTAGRETEAFLAELEFPGGVSVVSVNESGASIYSASKVAREEFPDHDITVRGAVSIGRRLQDPLAELVKIDPKSIGVGQYQHDVDSRKLHKALDDTVSSCVNSVGVDVNTASRQLLSYVSGLSSSVAGNLVKWRNENGPFSSRRQLMKVPRLGGVAYQQSAGFLRIRGGQNPLDASAVHPESYSIVLKMADSLEAGVRELIESEELRHSIRLENFVTDNAGLPTLHDIMEELEKPGRDPREAFQFFRFADVHAMKDIAKEMILPGIVTNVTNFGAFVDIGIHQDGLVHISQLADRYVRNPSEIVSVGDMITVKVLDVDEKRKRISLSMRGLKR